MNWLDYRKALGISTSNKEKTALFIKRVEVFIQSAGNCPFSELDEMNFAYMIGHTYLLTNADPFDISFGNNPKGLQRAWLYLEKHTEQFDDFLSCVVALINTYVGKASDKRSIISGVKKALGDSQIGYEIKKDNDGIFFFPKGAKELDDALVSQPLSWLAEYPKAHTAYIKALKAYSEATSDNASDIADKFRKTLETFFQEFFVCDKTLENCKGLYGGYLKSQNIPAEITANFETLLQAYTNFINGYAKHHDKTGLNVLEYIMYQTGNIIRLLITLKQAE